MLSALAFPIDIRSLLLAMMVNVLTTAVVLLAVMDRSHPAARRAQLGAVLQAMGWLLIIGSSLARNTWIDHLLSSLSMACMAGSLACLCQAYELWCGHEKTTRLPWVVALVMPPVYALGFHDYAFRVGWSNGLLALQMVMVALAVGRPPAVPVGPWRWLVVGCMLLQAVVTAWRGVLGAFFTEAYPTFLTPHPVNIASGLVAQASALLVLMGILLAHRDEAARELQRLATVDGLTGLLNRRAWLQRATAEFSASTRYRHPLAVLMIDMDHFKQVNDLHGHAAGDRALRLCSRELMAVLRSGDFAGRYGGEELCVLLTHADTVAVKAFDRRFRERLAQTAHVELGFDLDYSAGVAVRTDDQQSLEDVLHRADNALYRAKAEGRARTMDEQGGLVSAESHTQNAQGLQPARR